MCADDDTTFELGSKVSSLLWKVAAEISAVVTWLTTIIMFLILDPINWTVTLICDCTLAATPHLQAAWQAVRLAAACRVAGRDVLLSRCVVVAPAGDYGK